MTTHAEVRSTTFNCSNCEYVSKVKGSVDKHIKKVCNGAELISNITKVKCDICDKEYDTEKYLKAHKKICIEKKCLVVEKLENSSVINDKLEGVLNMVVSLTKDISDLQKQTKDQSNIIKSLTNCIETSEKHKVKNIVDCSNKITPNSIAPSTTDNFSELFNKMTLEEKFKLVDEITEGLKYKV